MKHSATFKKAALAATAALSLAGCGEAAQTAGSGLAAANASTRVFPANCAVRVRMDDINSPYTSVTYDFHYSTVNLKVERGGHTQSFHAVSNPKAQAEIQTAHRLLPASANCPAPVFAPAAG
jgi:hypothetical protein